MPINRDSWQQLEPLLDQALDLGPDERERWLKQLSLESPALAAELTTFLEEEALADRRDFLASMGDVTLAGLVLGAYQLEQPLGQGGMGTVWLARRVDGQFEGTAAVKLLNLALLSTAGQERFRREGSVLARLTHPNIARLLDAGVSGAGQPYLVLEHVDGITIDQFAEDHNLGKEGRIRLFLQVLAAVGHAHANLIVHRDLKPSNILVTADGAVKLLDFGIAKLLGDDSAGGTALTLEGARVFTPDYAAPEQVKGETLTTTTDVYALGVLLYVLLSGKHPTGEQARTPADSVRTLLEREPPPLHLGDLDNILSKALNKSPGQRYQTVAAFGDDLERHLRQEPVSARPPSVWYRGGKFFRRNRVAVIAASATGAGLIVATVFSLAQMREARLQRDEARAQRDVAVYHDRRAAASRGFMELLLQTIAPTGRAYTMQEMLDKSRELLERDYGQDPRYMGRMMVELADHYFRLHDRTQEISLLTRAEALATAAEDSETAAYAACRLGKTTADDGDVRGSEGHLARAAGYLSQLPNEVTGPRVQCLRARSALARLVGQTETAVVRSLEAIALGQLEGDTLSFTHLSSINELARALNDDGRVRDALDMTRKLIFSLDHTGRGSTMSMVVERYNEAAILSSLGEKQTAAAALTSIMRVASGIDPEQRVPAYITLLTGALAADLAQPESSIATFRRALAETRERGDVPYQIRALVGLTGVLIDRGNIDEARQRLDELKRIVPETLRWRVDLLEACLQHARGESVEGRKQYLEVLRSRGFPGKGRTTPNFANLVLEASVMARQDGDAAAAESLAVHAIRLARLEGQNDTESGVIGYARLVEAEARRARGDSAGTLAAIQQALGVLGRGYGTDHPRTLEARAILAAPGAAAVGPSASRVAPFAQTPRETPRPPRR